MCVCVCALVQPERVVKAVDVAQLEGVQEIFGKVPTNVPKETPVTKFEDVFGDLGGKMAPDAAKHMAAGGNTPFWRNGWCIFSSIARGCW